MEAKEDFVEVDADADEPVWELKPSGPLSNEQ